MTERKQFVKSWLCNISVALVIVGGFQESLPTKMRVVALSLASAAFILGCLMSKGGK